MRTLSRVVALASLAAVTALPLAHAAPPAIAEMRDAVLGEDEVAWSFVESLTTEIGPRLAGTEAEARARAWAVKRLQALGFHNVRDEPFMMSSWVRGVELAAIAKPFPQPLSITALGNSGATPPKGIRAEVVRFTSLAELEAAPAGSLTGKIAYISHTMGRTQDGSSYGWAGAVRRKGPSLAASKGAVAAVIRSIGTGTHRAPHTGATNFATGQAAIPAGALSVPDAEQLDRVFERGLPVTLDLILTPRQIGQTRSGNVIAEVQGSDPSAGIVLLACHLDSWDLGTGAIDDAAGCGIITAAAKAIMARGQPRRTIRLLLAGAEEVGVFGGAAYAQAHGGETHAVALESDFGAGRIWRFESTRLASPVAQGIAQALAPLGIAPSMLPAGGGADIGAIVKAQGAAVIDLQQDGTHYFDLHHTPDDTLDKIDPMALRQNVAAWIVTVAILADAPENLRVAE